MHTDEYEISLSRELAVCEQYVRKYGKIVAGMEERHGMSTDEFLKLGDRIALAGLSSCLEWEQAHEAFLRWSAAREEYARLLQHMRISP